MKPNYIPDSFSLLDAEIAKVALVRSKAELMETEFPVYQHEKIVFENLDGIQVFVRKVRHAWLVIDCFGDCWVLESPLPEVAEFIAKKLYLS